MMFKNRVFSVASTVVLLAGSATAIFAQEADKSGNPKGEETVTGCLSKGSSDSQYMFTDSKTGTPMTVTGSADLSKHAANHTVKLTGTKSMDGGKTVFTVTKVEHVSATCDASAPK